MKIEAITLTFEKHGPTQFLWKLGDWKPGDKYFAVEVAEPPSREGLHVLARAAGYAFFRDDWPDATKDILQILPCAMDSLEGTAQATKRLSASHRLLERYQKAAIRACEAITE